MTVVILKLVYVLVRSYPMLLQKESFHLISLLKFIKVWMTPLFGEQTVCVIVLE